MNRARGNVTILARPCGGDTLFLAATGVRVPPEKVMKRTVRGAVVSVVAALGAAAASPACVEYPQSIIVTKTVEPELKEDTNTCLVNPGAEALINGVLDLEVSEGGYVGALIVKNQLRIAAYPEKARVETGAVYLLGASVRLTFAGGLPVTSDRGGQQGNEFRTSGSGYLPPGGEAGITVNLIDGAAARTIKAQLGSYLKQTPPAEAVDIVVANVRVQGQTLGGLSVESQEFQFPITVCRGCLVKFFEDKANPTNKCSVPGDALKEQKVPCNIGQNRAIECNLCPDSATFCKTGQRVL